ncbi:MAG: TIGR03862 family flavoprotein [Verrucomicrobia bacterium]|nr:TIGR03862 family flavoprotein [Verrucomicrobiota bacterium]
MNNASAVVVGAGPAGLRAAEIIAQHGIRTTIFDQKASPGRKFLVAGRGGLNITHSEPIEEFARRYDVPDRWMVLLRQFSPDHLREWFKKLGVETFVGTSGRVFPRNIRTPMVLELWLERLDALGVDFQVGRRFHQMLGNNPYDLVFQRGKKYQLVTADAVVFALGGASWPQTGSDALWVEEFRRLGVQVQDFVAANVGWERSWSEGFLSVADGKPLKNLQVTCANRAVKGEMMITKYGLEGGALYQLTRELRVSPEIEIDFKPGTTPAELKERLGGGELIKERLIKSCRLSPASAALIEEVAQPQTLNQWISALKHCRIVLERPRPIAEAISSAGGVPWDQLTDDLMLRSVPGVFCAGEMLDWEAPTGGYLMQGCFATGTIAGQGAAKWIAKGREP